MRTILLLFLLFAIPARSALARTEISVDGPSGRVEFYRTRVAVLLEEVERALGFTSRGPIRVRLARTEEEFREWAGELPDWVVAIARSGERTLVVRLPVIGPGRGTDITSVLRHELLHVVLPERIGGAFVPRWFEEGLAQVLGGRINRSDRARLPVAAAAGRLIPLSDLRFSFPRQPSAAQLAYAQGESVVEYMIDRRGPSGLLLLLDQVRDHGDFSAAVIEVHGVTPTGLEMDWKDWLAEEGEPWWSVLLTGSIMSLLFFVASLLVIVAWWRARRRTRLTYDSLPD